MVRPNRNAQADKALQRQLISHQLCWGPAWARLRSTDRETDGTGLAGGLSTVLRARIRVQTSVYIIRTSRQIVYAGLRPHARVFFFSPCVFLHFRTWLCTLHTHTHQRMLLAMLAEVFPAASCRQVKCEETFPPSAASAAAGMLWNSRRADCRLSWWRIHLKWNLRGSE